MGNQGVKLENSALRSSAGSETHWLIFWHFDGHVVRLYHDIVGVILLFDSDVNVFQKIPRKDVNEANVEKYTAELDGKSLELTIVNDSPGLSIGGVEVFNTNSKYSYNLTYDNERIPHANERSATCPIQMLSSIVSAEYIEGATSKKYKRGVFTIETKLYHKHEVIAVKMATHRFNDFLDLSSDVYAFFRSRPALYNALPSLPWRIPKFIVSQGPEELEQRRSSIHAWIQKASSMPGSPMLPSLTKFLGFNHDEVKAYIDYKFTNNDSNSKTTASSVSDKSDNNEKQSSNNNTNSSEKPKSQQMDLEVV